MITIRSEVSLCPGLELFEDRALRTLVPVATSRQLGRAVVASSIDDQDLAVRPSKWCQTLKQRGQHPQLVEHRNDD